ncbi:MAG: hypothetical protein QGM46_09190 [Actinomycetota bacterium]|nr:hypothetical protein [Actinomycetota bacterium]MDK1027463.1 hypothetical protein [Actinomycetota bacterium]MDK1038533.1 hypothetical protein [Actinomycetota bacterium]MDK1292496.1 hypothetical protein [Actinomycetota bacterium]
MASVSERSPRNSAGTQSDEIELDLAEFIAAVFDEFPSLQVTVLPLGSHHDAELLRVRPPTPVPVQELLRRLRHGVATEGFPGKRVTHVAGGYRLEIEQRAERVDDSVEVDLGLDLGPIRSIDPIPHVAVANALRTRELRARLLESGAHNYESLARGRDCSVEAARQFVSRALNKHQLITVRHEERTFVPQFLLDDVLDPVLEFSPVIKTLAEVGERGWAAWTWLVTPSSWLDGKIPAELILRGDSDAVYTAVARRASNAA